MNPLAFKASAILSTSYSDTEFRETLALIDQRCYHNEPKTRRQVRLDLLSEVMNCNGHIVNEFGHIAEHLQQIKATIKQLNTEFTDMRTRVVYSHDTGVHMAMEATRLLKRQKQVESGQRLLGALKQRFLLTEDHITALTQTTEPVDDRFFTALDTCKGISRDCEVLLGLESQILGTETMTEASRYIDLGFQKLYKWVQREFQSLNIEDIQMSPNIRRALRLLAERPAHFQNSLALFSSSRERILTEMFYVALTGTPNQSVGDTGVKPIDMAAHDPLRYAGDMLAWIHSATVSEREALAVLFVAEGRELAKDSSSCRDTDMWRSIAGEGYGAGTDLDAATALDQLVDRDVSGAVQMLGQRLEQVIQSNEDVIIAHKLANLIRFYRVTLRRTSSQESGLIEVVSRSEAEAFRQFKVLSRERTATLQGDARHPPADLSPPAFFEDCLNHLGLIAKSFDSSLSVADEGCREFDEIVAVAFEPFMRDCDSMASTLKLPAQAIFLVNCKLRALRLLRDCPFAHSAARRLQRDVDQELERLLECQYSFLVAGSGLGHLFESVMRPVPEAQSVITKESLSAASLQFDDFLPTALLDAVARLNHLQDHSLGRDITDKAAGRFCQSFEALEAAIETLEERSGVDDSQTDGTSLKAIFPRTLTEVRVLLS